MKSKINLIDTMYTWEGCPFYSVPTVVCACSGYINNPETQYICECVGCTKERVGV